jgi:hypothetical protein
MCDNVYRTTKVSHFWQASWSSLKIIPEKNVSYTLIRSNTPTCWSLVRRTLMSTMRLTGDGTQEHSLNSRRLPWWQAVITSCLKSLTTPSCSSQSSNLSRNGWVNHLVPWIPKVLDTQTRHLIWGDRGCGRIWLRSTCVLEYWCR